MAESLSSEKAHCAAGRHHYTVAVTDFEGTVRAKTCRTCGLTETTVERFTTALRP